MSNFTDVDDKIIKKANEEGVPSEVISTRYIEECKKDMEAMNVKPATTHPLATQEIGGMVEMIQELIEKGYAYNVDGTVYFRTRKFQEYGKLSHKNLDDLRSGNRSLLVTGEDQKEDPLDFVLWKPKKEGEPSWPSPWSDGRPGWHIECSVMAKKYLGEENRYPCRRRGPDFPPPRERDCPERVLQRQDLCQILAPQRLPEYRQQKDEQIPGKISLP